MSEPQDVQIDIQAATALLDGQAAKCDTEAQDLTDAASALMASAKIAADKILSDAQAQTNKPIAQAQAKRAEAKYWRQLAAEERRKAGLPQPGAPAQGPQAAGEPMEAPR